jgi:hypothetical protein
MLSLEPGASAAGAVVIGRSPVGTGRSEGGGDRGVSPLLEAREAALERTALDQHVAVAGATPEPDIGAEAVDEPDVPAAGVAPPEPDNIAEEQLEHGSDGHAGRA